MSNEEYNAMLVDINEVLEIQKANCRPEDEYMRGMYNGMELIRSLITCTEPIFMREDTSLDNDAVERNPERFI